MEERLSLDEIKAKYPDEWVILVDLDRDDHEQRVHGGVVFSHSKCKKDLLASTKEALSGKSRAILFTGEVGRGNYLF